MGSLKNVFDFFDVHELFGQRESQRSFEIVCGHIPSICEHGASLIASNNIEADDEIRF